MVCLPLRRRKNVGLSWICLVAFPTSKYLTISQCGKSIQESNILFARVHSLIVIERYFLKIAGNTHSTSKFRLFFKNLPSLISNLLGVIRVPSVSTKHLFMKWGPMKTPRKEIRLQTMVIII